MTVRPPLLDASWLGTIVTDDVLETFEKLGADPCGENGEYHTVVTNCSLFSSPLQLTAGARVQHGGCWAMDVLVTDVA